MGKRPRRADGTGAVTVHDDETGNGALSVTGPEGAWTIHIDDAAMTGLTPESLLAMLECTANDPHRIRVRWTRAPSRAALQAVYDALQWTVVATPCPAMAEALAAWDSLQPACRATLKQAREAVDEKEDHYKTTTLDALVTGAQLPAGMVSHAQLLVGELGFPRTQFEREHVRIANDLHERLHQAQQRAPRPKMQMYMVDEIPVPLFLWYATQRENALRFLREYIHLVWGGCSSPPAAAGGTVWQWNLLPSSVPLALVTRHFEAAQLLPYWTQLARCVLGEDITLPSMSTVETYAGRLQADTDMCVYDTERPGAFTMFLGDAGVFFGVRSGGAGLRTVRLPQRADELPRWVKDLLEELVRSAPPQACHYAVGANLDSYLAWFAAQPVGADVRLLREIDWGRLPLHWRPAFLREVPHTVTVAQADQAQARLLQEVAQDWDAAETLTAALERLNRITGIASSVSYYHR